MLEDHVGADQEDRISQFPSARVYAEHDLAVRKCCEFRIQLLDEMDNRRHVDWPEVVTVGFIAHSLYMSKASELLTEDYAIYALGEV